MVRLIQWDWASVIATILRSMVQGNCRPCTRVLSITLDIVNVCIILNLRRLDYGVENLAIQGLFRLSGVRRSPRKFPRFHVPHLKVIVLYPVFGSRRL